VQGWLLGWLLRRHGRALLTQEELRARLAQLEQLEQRPDVHTDPVLDTAGGSSAPGRPDPPVPEPIRTPQPPIADRMRVRQYAVFQRMQDEAIRAAPPYPAGRFAGAGIVILAGGRATTRTPGCV
jgi:hypothetical protein